MKKNIQQLVSIILIFISISIPKVINADNQNNILFISSYAPSFISFNDQIEGFSDGFKGDYELQIEYMDVKKFRNEKVENTFYNLLKFKMENYEKFNAVILADDAALNFGLKYKDSLFKDIPIIFLGVSEEENIKNAKNANISGVIEYSSISETIEQIITNHYYKTLYEGKKNFTLITGNQIKYKKEIDEFFSFQSKYENFEFNYISIPPEIDENFLTDLKPLNEFNSIVLFVYPYRDGIGKSISILESNSIIAKNINAPIYVALDYNLSTNTIGGKVISHYNQGKKAGELTHDILVNDNKNAQIIEDFEVNNWMFNYKTLENNGVSKKILPKNSIVLDEPISFFVKYKEIIIPGTITIVGLLSVIFALIAYTIKRRIYEKELCKAIKLAEDASNAKNNFISNISHELRTPVAIISSSNQLLRKLILKNNTSNENIVTMNNNFDIISKNSNRLLRLINNIIDVAKIDSGFTDLKLENTDIISLIEDTALSVIPYAQEKNLEIIFDTNVEELIMAVDIEKIERVILNLLSNSIKYSDSSGEILTSVTVSDNNITITIKDAGVGIDEKNLSHIFDKFMQVDNLLTRKNEGSGIGLSIVKSFVDLHEGSISVKSVPGEGTTFTIELPIKVLSDNDGDLNKINVPGINTDIELSDIYVRK